jgi:hypothetical protein
MIKTTPSILTKVLAVAVLLGGTSGAFANQVTLSTNAYSDGYGGGEFSAVGTGLSTAGYASSTLLSGGFETFCLAYNEEFVGGGTYNYTLGNSVLSNTGGPAIPVSLGTAYLYSQFAAGTLSGYDYSSSGTGGSTFASRNAAATALQVALWWAEQEGSGEANSQGAPGAGGGTDGYDSSNIFEKMIFTQFGLTGATNVFSAANGADGVSLMLLSNSNPSDGSVPNSQPQLYYNVPDNGTTALLLGVGLLGLAAFRRKSRLTS